MMLKIVTNDNEIMVTPFNTYQDCYLESRVSTSVVHIVTWAAFTDGAAAGLGAQGRVGHVVMFHGCDGHVLPWWSATHFSSSSWQLTATVSMLKRSILLSNNWPHSTDLSHLTMSMSVNDKICPSIQNEVATHSWCFVKSFSNVQLAVGLVN